MIFTKRRIVIFLIVIALASLFCKLYTVDFSLPVANDNLGFTLNAIQYSQGDFFLQAKKGPGWPMFIAPFMTLVNSDNFIDYSNLVRTLSLGIATFTIFPMYLLGRKFFNEKYALIVAIVFAFEPHLNFNSGLGLTEPLFLLVYIASFYFILNKNQKYIYLSFIFATILTYIRFEGALMLVALSIIYFVNFRKSPDLIKKYLVCVIIVFIILSPGLIQRYVQYGDPLYVWYNTTLFADSYSDLYTSPTDGTPTSYIEKHGVGSFIDKFILTGSYNLLKGMTSASFPYLFILIPFGMLFSLRAFDQNHLYIRANWIVILTMLAVLVVIFSQIPDKRFVMPLYPFLMIFSVIPIQRLIEYGLSTFSFSHRKKRIFLITIILIIVVLSVAFTHGVGKYGFGKPDVEKEHEKMTYAMYAIHNFDGRMLDGDGTMEYVYNIQIIEAPGGFKEYKSNKGVAYPDTYTPGHLTSIRIDGKTLEELISDGEKHGVKYIAVNGEFAYFFPFLLDVYNNEKQYPYMVKIFDSTESGYKKIKIKVFEIDYKKFHEIES